MLHIQCLISLQFMKNKTLNTIFIVVKRLITSNELKSIPKSAFRIEKSPNEIGLFSFRQLRSYYQFESGIFSILLCLL